MTAPTLRAWIAARTPPVPRGYADRLRAERPEATAGVESLTREAISALHRALAEEPSGRDAAFHLLAADGFATWACEAALEGANPEAELDGIVDALLG